MDYNSAPNENIGDWYQLFITDNSQQVEPKEQVVAAKNALGELMIYAIQAKACSELITGIMNSIDLDIRNDILNDERGDTVSSAVANGYPVEQGPAVIAPKPLSMAITNRDKMVKAAEKLNALVKSVDSILSRVKIKEND